MAEDSPPAWIKLDVPYVRTPPAVVDAMLDLAAVGAGDVVYDLGSGDGRIVIAAVRDRGARRGVGIDLNPLRVTEATANAQAAGVADRVTFIEGDVFTADFSAASVVTMYLWDNVNLRLRPRLLSELRPGTRVVSHQFHMFDWTPDKQVMVGGQVPVYFWIVPARVEGVWRGAAGNEIASFNLTQTFQSVAGTVVVDGANGGIRSAKMAGLALTLDAALDEGAFVRFQGDVVDDALVGKLTNGDTVRAITLRRSPSRN
jgi:SAM-dependent methyltransferase